LIASNAAILQRDAVHLVTSFLPPPYVPLSTPLVVFKQPAGTFTASLNYISLIFGYKSSPAMHICAILEAVGLCFPVLSPTTPCCCLHVNALEIFVYFCIFCRRCFCICFCFSCCFMTKCQSKLSRSVAIQLSFLWHISLSYILKTADSFGSTWNLWPCDYCFTCLWISFFLSYCM